MIAPCLLEYVLEVEIVIVAGGVLCVLCNVIYLM